MPMFHDYAKITRCQTPSTKQVGSGKYPQGEKAQEKMLRGRYSEEGFVHTFRIEREPESMQGLPVCVTLILHLYVENRSIIIIIITMFMQA